jgi:hypothetical protein
MRSPPLLRRADVDEGRLRALFFRIGSSVPSGHQVNGVVLTLQNPGERMAVEQIAELRVT